MSYEELCDLLRSNHLYPSMETNLKGDIISLEVYAPGLQAERRLEICKEVIGKENYRADYFPNLEKITITVKKK